MQLRYPPRFLVVTLAKGPVPPTRTSPRVDAESAQKSRRVQRRAGDCQRRMAEIAWKMGSASWAMIKGF